MKLSSSKPVFDKEYFLLLLPLFFVFHGFVENYPLVQTPEGLRLLGFYLLIILSLAALSFLLFKNWRKASVFVFFIYVFHFFFGSFHDSLKNSLGDFFITRYVFIIPAAFISLIILFIFIKKTNRKFNRLRNYANLLFMLLVVLDLLFLFSKIDSRPKALSDKDLKACDTCKNRDIYFIVADEYAGNIALRDMFNFDNSGFENELQRRGFHIVDSSVSNYNYTFFSIASTLQMEYLSGIEGRNSSKKDRNLTYKIINKNKLTDFLEKAGYTFKNYSVFNFNDQPVISNSVFFKTGKDLITSQTFIERINRDIRFNLISRFKIKSELEYVKNVWLNNISTNYDATLKEASSTSTNPRFIYTHLMMPHYPYFFDSNGNPNALEKVLEGHQTNKKDYVEYLKYSNKKFLHLIDHILAASKKPPIIVFMSDHGFRHYNDADRKYGFINFSAVYFPDKNYTGFYKGMSNVNLFREILNSQFDQQLHLLKDSTSFLVE